MGPAEELRAFRLLPSLSVGLGASDQSSADLRAEFGLSQGDWSLVYMAGTLANALVLP